MPFWTFFSVQPALQALQDHLQTSAPYRIIDILQFQHGAHSHGIASPAQWLATARQQRATAHLLALDPRRFPHDIVSLGRYGHALAQLPQHDTPGHP